MPINYHNSERGGNVVQYASGNGSPWQVNPSKILNVKTATSSYGDETTSNSEYETLDYVTLKRKQADSIFYVQIAGRVKTGLSWTDYQYDVNNTYLYWSHMDGVSTRYIFWEGTLVTYETKPAANSWNAYPRINFNNTTILSTLDGYEYNGGGMNTIVDRQFTVTWIGTRGWMKAPVRRRAPVETAGNDEYGIPEIKINLGNYYMHTNTIHTLGGPWIGDADFNSNNDGGPKSEDTYEFSGYLQPPSDQFGAGDWIRIATVFKNANSKGIVWFGTYDVEYFRMTSMRIYEIAASASTCIMKPDDAHFKLTEGKRPALFSGARPGNTHEFLSGYGIPNHYWTSQSPVAPMYSRGIRCLIPNHTKFGEWVAFGYGFMTVDGSGGNSSWSGSGADGADVNEGNMAGMITQDNGVTWNQIWGGDGYTPIMYHIPVDVGNTTGMPTTYPNEFIVYDWATNGSTTSPEWVMTGREVWSKQGSKIGGKLTIYHTTQSNLQFWEKLDVVPRRTSGKGVRDQYLKSVCYSNGYWVFGSNSGHTCRSSNLSSFSSWKDCNFNKTHPLPVYCLTSNDGGSKIVAGGNSLSYSTDSGNTWTTPPNHNYRDDWFVPQPHGSGKNYNTRAIFWNITYVGDTEVYVTVVDEVTGIRDKVEAKGPGVWIACGYKRKTTGTSNPSGSEHTVYPLYAYSENMIDWHEIDVENDTNLPYNGWYDPSYRPWSGNAGGYTCFPNSVRERITYCKESKKLLTWANAGPGPSQFYDNNEGRLLDHHNSELVGSNGYYNGGYHPFSTEYSQNNKEWDSSTASLWVSDMSLTNWRQVSAGTPFIGAEYSGTDNAPTTATSYRDGKYRGEEPRNDRKTGQPNVFQFPADGYAHGRYMVGSTQGEVHNRAGGRVAYIDI